MIIEFTRPYRGKLTSEQYYESGAVADFSDNTAQLLIARGVAIDATPPPKAVTKRATRSGKAKVTKK